MWKHLRASHSCYLIRQLHHHLTTHASEAIITQIFYYDLSFYLSGLSLIINYPGFGLLQAVQFMDGCLVGLLLCLMYVIFAC